MGWRVFKKYVRDGIKIYVYSENESDEVAKSFRVYGRFSGAENLETKRDGRRVSLADNGFVARFYEFFVKYSCALFCPEAILCSCIDGNKRRLEVLWLKLLYIYKKLLTSFVIRSSMTFSFVMLVSLFVCSCKFCLPNYVNYPWQVSFTCHLPSVYCWQNVLTPSVCQTLWWRPKASWAIGA